jgi:hypothetical protein
MPTLLLSINASPRQENLKKSFASRWHINFWFDSMPKHEKYEANSPCLPLDKPDSRSTTSRKRRGIPVGMTILCDLGARHTEILRPKNGPQDDIVLVGRNFKLFGTNFRGKHSVP